MPKSAHVLDFSEVNRENISTVGGKAANLGELTQSGFPVPPGFIIPESSYKLFIKENDFEEKIKALLKTVNIKKPEELQEISRQIIRLLTKGKIPEDIQHEVKSKYDKMGSFFKKATVAVRSSGIAQDISSTSFAGQQETYLNIQGDTNLLNAVRDCWASLFSPRAIFYREEKGIDHFKSSIAIIVQEMISSQVSGIAFTQDPTNSEKTRMIIEAVWGLGESIVDGKITPDTYEVDRHSREILNIYTSVQTKELVIKGNKNEEVKVPKSRENKQKLSEEEIKKLSSILQKLHAHYFFPQNIEWAYSRGKFYIIEASPITTIRNKREVISDKTDEKNNSGEIILEGAGASTGIVTGLVKIIKSPRELSKIKKGEILVTEMTLPDFMTVMKLAAAIITDEGGITSHAAIVSRELGIPCIVGTGDATKKLKDGMVVTVNAKEGVVYKGNNNNSDLKGNSQSYSKTKTEKPEKPREDLKTATKIYVNLAEPENAREVAKLPIDGVGLLRAEFMVAEIGVHPKHLLAQNKQEKFVSKLAAGLETFCQEFEPRPIVYRTTDFKTNEYRDLDGGRDYEPEESNPMLGYRGAYRYISDPAVFELELAAIKRVREKYKNLWVMIPFCRSPQELLQVKRIMAASGLMRSPTFKLWMMVELPVNVILIEDFIKVGIDGVSIGSNDLTMLLEGTDRDNSEVASAFNELSPAVLWSLERVIKACRKHKITSSICGQAVSTYDTLVEELVNLGITSVSVNPDAIARTQKMIYGVEHKLVYETERRLIK